jgi:HD-GYP domain-containing protein (c-di-GMP phosphodiesterase class II)
MTLALDLEYNDTVLLKKDVILTRKYIEKILRIDETLSVFIKGEFKEDKNIQNFIDESSENLKNKVHVLETMSSNVKNIFDNFQSDSNESINQLKSVQNEISKEFTDFRNTLVNIIGRDPNNEYLYSHSINVGILSYMLGKWLKLEENELNNLLYAAVLHDIGKIKIDNAILNKVNKLTTEEFKYIQKHALIGYEILKNIPNLDRSVYMGVLMHHERMDGSGYPLKIMGNQIHKFGRIIAITDAFSAMNTERSYKRKYSPLKALGIMHKESLHKYDYTYWNIFFNNMVGYYTGERVLLNTKEEGKIIKINKKDIPNPLIILDNSQVIDLSKDDNRFVIDIIDAK